MFASLRAASRRRKLLDAMVISGNTGPLVEFLREARNEEAHVAEFALVRVERHEVWAGLLAAAALAEAGCDSAVAILQKLADHSRDAVKSLHKPVPWKALPPEALRAIRRSLRKAGCGKDADDLLAWLTPEGAAAALASPEEADFASDLLAYLTAGQPASRVAPRINEGIEEAARRGPHREAALTPYWNAAEALWGAGQWAASLSVLCNLDLTRAGRFPSEFLEVVAEGLAQWRGLDQARAASLLERHPMARWVPALQSAWVREEESVTVRASLSAGKEFTESAPAPEILAAANRILVALGTCAAADERYTTLGPAQQSEELEALHRKWTALATEYGRLRDRFVSNRSGGEALARRAKEIRQQMHLLEGQTERLSDDLMRSASPGRLLLTVLQHAQRYPAEIRQAAAWAATRLRETGNLDEPSRQAILQAVRRAVTEKDPAELSASVGELVEDERQRAAVGDAAIEYFHNGNYVKFTAALDGLAIPEETRSEIVATCDTFARNVSHHFNERVVRLLPGQSFLEMEETITAGLVWMADVAEFSGGGADEDDDDVDYSQVRSILTLLRELAPGGLQFLVRYPLRLMTLDHHKRLLGQYSRTKCGITLWTRYTAPAWRPGVENAGKVHARYLQLDDRSVPNSMGIWSGLFSHPILALPVIYHEFLHFGGPGGDPDRGIENETEVLLREILFARGLIARMAPEGDRDIPLFEQDLVGRIRSARIHGLAHQLRYDLQDDEVLDWILGGIVSAYGAPLTPDEVAREVSREFMKQNRYIDWEHESDDEYKQWHPEVTWPHLLTPRTQGLSRRYSEMLKRVLSVDHRIDSSHRDRILAAPECIAAQQAWNSYCQRPSALLEFEREYPADAIDPEEALTAIVNRVGSLAQDGDSIGMTVSMGSTLAYLLRSAGTGMMTFSESDEPDESADEPED
jgi:hypothetical protein